MQFQFTDFNNIIIAFWFGLSLGLFVSIPLWIVVWTHHSEIIQDIINRIRTR